MGKYWICICLAWGLGIGGCTPVQQYRYTEGKIYGTFYHISYAFVHRCIVSVPGLHNSRTV
jgi:thiamine biosynthesis lipoprotein